MTAWSFVAGRGQTTDCCRGLSSHRACCGGMEDEALEVKRAVKRLSHALTVKRQGKHFTGVKKLN